MLNRSRNRKHNTQHTGEDEQNPGGRTRGYATRRGVWTVTWEAVQSSSIQEGT